MHAFFIGRTKLQNNSRGKKRFRRNVKKNPQPLKTIADPL